MILGPLAIALGALAMSAEPIAEEVLVLHRLDARLKTVGLATWKAGGALASRVHIAGDGRLVALVSASGGKLEVVRWSGEGRELSRRPVELAGRVGLDGKRWERRLETEPDDHRPRLLATSRDECVQAERRYTEHEVWGRGLQPDRPSCWCSPCSGPPARRSPGASSARSRPAGNGSGPSRAATASASRRWGRCAPATTAVSR